MRFFGAIAAGLGVLGMSLVFGIGVAWAANPHVFSSSFSETLPGSHMVSPFGVGVDTAGGHVYVVDGEAGVLDEFGLEGQFQAQFPVAGNGLFGMAVDNSGGLAHGEVYVVAAESGVVYRSEVVAGKEQFVPFIEVAEPKGVAVDSEGNIYVAVGSLENGAIDKYSSEGKPLATPLIGGVEEPFGVAVGPNGDVYVASRSTGTTAYNAAGQCLAAGCTPFDSGGISGVTVDQATGDVYTLGFFGGIGEYTSSGALIERFGTGQLAGQFAAGIGVDDEASPFGQLVYASDASAGDVDVYLRASLEAVLSEPALHGQSVTFRGTVTPGGQSVGSCEFEYGETSSYTGKVACAQSPGSLGSGNTPVAVSAEVGGLTPTKTYHYRLVASNAKATVESPDAGVKVLPPPPGVLGVTTSVLRQSYAILNAQIDPNRGLSAYRFEYGPTASYGTSVPVPDASVGEGSEAVNVGQPIEGLRPGSTYHYRVVASNEGGTTTTPDQTFTTPAAAPPLVSIAAANEVTPNTARISGTINPEGLQTSYEFDIGTDTTYGSRISGDVGSAASPQNVTLPLQGLAPETTYHYRLLASNYYGSTYSADETFTTPGYPTALLGAPATPALIAIPPIVLPTEPAGTTTGPTTPAAKPKQKTKHSVKRHKPKGRKAAKAGGARIDGRAAR